MPDRSDMPAANPTDEWFNEVSACIVHNFHFLVEEFGYHRPKTRSLKMGTHALDVSWRRAKMRVDVIADQFRNDLDAVVRKRGAGDDLSLSVGDLTKMFDIPGFTTCLGSTEARRSESIAKLAELLRAYGARALEGDEQIFLLVAERRRANLEAGTREREFRQALMDGRAAWQRRDYAGVVAALGPFSERLSPAKTKRLALARARLPARDS